MADKSFVRRRVAIAAATGLIIAAVITGVALGGLNPRKSQALPVPLGEAVDTGMMVYLPESATVTYHTTAATNPWEVIISMKVRNPQATSLAPVDSMTPSVFGVDPRTRLIAQGSSYYLGVPPEDEQVFMSSDRQLVPPDDEWIDMRLQVYPDASFVPGSTYIVGLRPMQFRVTTLYGYSQEKSWAPALSARTYTVEVPLTRLADTDD